MDTAKVDLLKMTKVSKKTISSYRFTIYTYLKVTDSQLNTDSQFSLIFTTCYPLKIFRWSSVCYYSEIA